MHLGIIGLGLMGRAFAHNLLVAGHQVTGWNRSAHALKPFLKEGGQLAQKPIAVFEKSDVVISVLADDQAITEIFLDTHLIEALPANTIHINMATVSIALTKILAETHARYQQHYIAAPVLGNAMFAQSAQLHILAAGNRKIIEQCVPIFTVIGKTLRILGEQTQIASIAKLAMNFLLGTAVEAMVEAHALVKRYNLEPTIYQEIIDNTFLGSPAYQMYGEKIAKETFEPAAFRLRLARKDLCLAFQSALAVNLKLPLAEAVIARLDNAITAGHGDKDLTALGLI